MRSIAKQGNVPAQLVAANAVPPQTSAEATTRWKSFKYKSAVQANLLTEQYFLCCYSEVRPDLLGLGFHIEHVRPKRYYPSLTFDYKNLAASALHSDDLQNIAVTEVFGGHAKQSEYDPALFVSCHDADSAKYFSYLSDGRIEPAGGLDAGDIGKATYTIQTLNLNSPFLVVQRQRWWDDLDQLYAEHQSRGWSLEHLAAIDLVPAAGKLTQFFSITRQFFGPVAHEVLQRDAPQLL